MKIKERKNAGLSIDHPLLKTSYYTQGQIEEMIKMTDIELEDYLIDCLVKHHSDKIVYNRCPKCNNLARTPRARQCPTCAYQWRNS